MSILGGRVEDGQIRWKMRGDGRSKYARDGDGSYASEKRPISLGRLTKDKLTPQRQLKSQIQAVFYLLVDNIGLAFGSVLRGKRRMIFESR